MIAGWVMNIVQIVMAFPVAWSAIGPMFVLKVVGVFAGPLGAVLGWVGLCI
jgi:hypothetical protein